MVQQTKDSTFAEYGLSCAESDLSNSDKQFSVSVAAKKSELQNSKDESPMMVSKSIRSPPLIEDNECAAQVKISGAKRPIPDCLLTPPKHNARNGHIVYVRRKPETDLAKINVTKSDAVDCSHLREFTDRSKATQHLKEIMGPVICTSDIAPLCRDSSPSFSSTRRSVSPTLERSSNISSPETIEHVHFNCANPSSENHIKMNVSVWEERYFHLQSLLKMLDQSDQCEYVQMLQTLSSVELSKHAVELEQRSINLSLEEAKEMRRVRFFDVLGKFGKNVSSSCIQQEQLHK